LPGCSLLGDKESILPQEGASIQDIYAAHFQRNQASLPAARAQVGAGGPGFSTGNLAGYSRAADNETEALFPRLPNPALVMYVFPHLAAGRRPVPGYATSFPMYEKAEYALPGEAEGGE
jgi:conjugative transfer region lipoprotein (TIGR03751 family)